MSTMACREIMKNLTSGELMSKAKSLLRAMVDRGEASSRRLQLNAGRLAALSIPIPAVADMPLYAGDPLTPFVGATKNAKRLPIKNAPTLTKIPVLPISYNDALPL